MGLDMKRITHPIDIVMIHYPLSFAIPAHYSLLCFTALIDIFSRETGVGGRRGQTRKIIFCKLKFGKLFRFGNKTRGRVKRTGQW